MNGKLNIWYILVGVAFVVGGVYRIVNGNFTAGLIWVVIGILFALLSCYGNKKTGGSQEKTKGKNKKK